MQFEKKDGLTIAGARITKTDIGASNGTIHIIDAVILPPSARRKLAGLVAGGAGSGLWRRSTPKAAAAAAKVPPVGARWRPHQLPLRQTGGQPATPKASHSCRAGRPQEIGLRPARLGPRGRRRMRGIVGPGVPRIAALHLGLDRRPRARPEARQVARDLDRPVRRRQQMQRQRQPAVGDRRDAASARTAPARGCAGRARRRPRSRSA